LRRAQQMPGGAGVHQKAVVRCCAQGASHNR
jgi:hypothetical protein